MTSLLLDTKASDASRLSGRMLRNSSQATMSSPRFAVRVTAFMT